MELLGGLAGRGEGGGGWRTSPGGASRMKLDTVSIASAFDIVGARGVVVVVDGRGRSGGWELLALSEGALKRGGGLMIGLDKRHGASLD